VASHGYFHRRCSDEASCGALEKDLADSRNLLEDITGNPVHGYRAPSFSITDNLLNVIEASGYSYDSSYNSFGMNERYGRVDLGQYMKEGISIRISEAFHEIPVSNLKVGGRVLPWGGGGYFRLIPLSLFRRGVQSILKREGAYLFYIHPWELDPGQPRINSIPAFYRFRHYVNLGRTHHKLSSLFGRLKGCRFVTCREYLELIRRSGT
jgi:polysaccharide deacetylase family protein (PEP-CTERM system associated)